MEELAEQFAAIDLRELGMDDAEIAKIEELGSKDCDELKQLELSLTHNQVDLAEKNLKPADEDVLTLQALSWVLLQKYVTKELSLLSYEDTATHKQAA